MFDSALQLALGHSRAAMLAVGLTWVLVSLYWSRLKEWEHPLWGDRWGSDIRYIGPVYFVAGALTFLLGGVIGAAIPTLATTWAFVPSFVTIIAVAMVRVMCVSCGHTANTVAVWVSCTLAGSAYLALTQSARISLRSVFPDDRLVSYDFAVMAMGSFAVFALTEGLVIGLAWVNRHRPEPRYFPPATPQLEL